MRGFNAFGVRLVPDVSQREGNQAELGEKGKPQKCRARRRYRGGGGWRVRAHIMDSESGGAKGHYPILQRRKSDDVPVHSKKKQPKAARLEKRCCRRLQRALLQHRDVKRIAAGRRILVQRRAQLSRETGHDSLETLRNLDAASGLGREAGRFDGEPGPIVILVIKHDQYPGRTAQHGEFNDLGDEERDRHRDILGHVIRLYVEADRHPSGA